MDKLLTPIALVKSALWISFHELLCCKWLTDCTSSLLWPCNVLALSSWVCVLNREQNSWNSKFSTPFHLISKTSAVLCLQMYLIKISKLISWGNKFILSFKKSSVLFQVIPPYSHFTHLPTNSSSPSTILTPPLHSHPTPSPPLPTPPSPLFASPNSALLSISSYLISVLIKCFFFYYFGSFYQGFVSAHGGYVWTSSSNSGEQITGESQKNSCAGNRERDVGERDKQCEGGITGINVRERDSWAIYNKDYKWK